MENSQRKAFSIRYGADMTKVKQTIDYSDLYTWVEAHDNYGCKADRSWTYKNDWWLHHHKRKRIHFNYSTDLGNAKNLERLAKDLADYFGTVCRPKITYEVEIANIKNDPKYRDFLKLQDFDIGDTGFIFCELFNMETEQKITQIKRNELTGEILSITLGDINYSIIRQNFMADTVSSGNTVADKQMQAITEQLEEDAFVKLVNTPVLTKDGEYLMTMDGEYLIYSE